MALVRLADQIQAAMPTPRYDPPWNDFWAHWQTLAKMWSLTAGRRRTSSKADQALRAWSRHPMIADEGWAPVERAVKIYDQPDRKRNDFVAMAADGVWDPDRTVRPRGLDNGPRPRAGFPALGPPSARRAAIAVRRPQCWPPTRECG